MLLAYRLLGWRLGPTWQAWVHDDLTRRGWLLRQGVPVFAALLAVGAVVTAAVGGQGDRLLALLAVLAGVGAFLRHSLQERALRQQGLDASGKAVAAWFHDDDQRRRHNLLSAVSTVVLVLAGLVLLAVRSR